VRLFYFSRNHFVKSSDKRQDYKCESGRGSPPLKPRAEYSFWNHPCPSRGKTISSVRVVNIVLLDILSAMFGCKEIPGDYLRRNF
jgi:hypothetical protein